MQSGGAIIDTNGFDIAIAEPLLDGGGGLTKNGNGILTGVQLFGTTTFDMTAGTLTVSAPLLAGLGGSTANHAKTGAGTLTIVGEQTYNTLTTSDGTTNLNSALGTGASTLNTDATTNISVSQTLAALNIGEGAIGTPAPTPPAPVFFAGDASFADTGEISTALLGVRRRKA